VTAVLGQLLSAGQQAAEDGDTETALSTVESAERVISNKVPNEHERKRLLHGCQRVRAHLGPDGTGDGAVAAEYLAAMERQVGEE
jgi:hypothetical protein